MFLLSLVVGSVENNTISNHEYPVGNALAAVDGMLFICGIVVKVW